MTEKENEPRVIIEIIRKNTFKLCCGDNCVELAVSVSDGSASSESLANRDPNGPQESQRDTPYSGATSDLPIVRRKPLGIGTHAALSIERFGVEGIEHLRDLSMQLLSSWQPPTQEGTVMDGIILFEIHNIASVDIQVLEPVYQLSKRAMRPVILRVFD
jgi:hypothetical protein